MVSICPLLWQRDVKLQQTNKQTKPIKQTREIYLKEINEIMQSCQIPEQWQIGDIKRLYKGKGANERGITLASNVGKLFERIVNNRITTTIHLTEAQAEIKSNSGPPTQNQRHNQAPQTKQEGSIHSIPRCHQSIRQGMVRCNTLCHAKRRNRPTHLETS